VFILLLFSTTVNMPKLKLKKDHSSQSLHYHPYETGKDNKSAIKNGTASVSFQQQAEDDEDASDNVLSKGQRKRLEKRQHVQQKLGLIKPTTFKEVPVKPVETKKQNKQGPKVSSDSNMQVEEHGRGNVAGKPVEAVESNSEENIGLSEKTISKGNADLSFNNLFTHASQSGRSSTSNKLTKETAIKELQRMKMVLQNPTFQQNPLSVIHQQLQLQQQKQKR
jgi:hypothetical protein